MMQLLRLFDQALPVLEFRGNTAANLGYGLPCISLER